MSDKFLAIDDVTGLKKEVNPIATSSGSGDAGKIAKTDSTGRFDTSLMPVGVAPDVQVIPATEDISAGNYVNIYNSSGRKCRKADNSNGRMAHGFVLNSVANGADATIFFEGSNTAASGLTPGSTIFLGTNGAPTETVPTGSVLLQYLGTATNTDTINNEIEKPIQRIP